ncbi:MAG: formate/nitrite transporter family protein [Actinomycetota bacterium]|nr:formate/nitrite transporter family protein [Actinomycetota bacterium]
MDHEPEAAIETPPGARDRQDGDRRGSGESEYIQDGRRRFPRRVDEELRGTFLKTVDEAQRRLSRSWPTLLATGAVGGIDVGVGVLALLLVREGTGNELLSAVAFGIGFIALTLGRSELFTENFLVPIAGVVAKKATVGATVRLWGGTAATNLAGGWALMGLVSVGLPELHEVAVEVGRHSPELGVGATSFASAVIGGAAITLMTWMERGTDSVPAKLVAVASVAFVLAAGRLNHAIVVSLEMFAALHFGAPFGYADWLGMASWAALGNLVGGLALVTVLRLVQIGRTVVEDERQRPANEPRPGQASPEEPRSSR